MKSRDLVLVILLVLTSLVQADFKSGGEAYKSGDYETAAREFLPLAEAGDHRAMYALGSMYSAGHGVPQDYEQAFMWFQRAAKYHRPDAEYKLGLLYLNGLGTAQDYRRAMNWFGRSAKKGFANAQFRIGQMYAEGLGVEPDPVKAYAWYGVALAQGLTDAKSAQDALDSTMTPEQQAEAETLSQALQEQYLRE